VTLDRASSDPTAPSDDELAAILAAVELAWPQPAAADTTKVEAPRWRFSGRWWAKPVAARRDRPS
jgi:hypothetical protein